jgi:hypothetical protein
VRPNETDLSEELERKERGMGLARRDMGPSYDDATAGVATCNFPEET